MQTQSSYEVVGNDEYAHEITLTIFTRNKELSEHEMLGALNIIQDLTGVWITRGHNGHAN